jgi:mono/diheme cytochrome c family protein
MTNTAMTNKGQKPSLIAPLGGVVVGIGVFLGVNITIGRAIIPTAASITNKSEGLSAVIRPADETASTPPAATGPYQTVCATCHQAEGQGLPGAFPPLAGSEWLLGNPEIPVRIVLLGLTGPIEVKGAKFTSTMPPPPGLTDDKIVEAISFARSHFGNHADPIDVELVKKVKASLAGRTASWTATELAALQAGAAADAAGAPAAGTAEPAAPPPAAAAAPRKKKVAAPKQAAPSAAPAAPAAAPTAPPAQ